MKDIRFAFRGQEYVIPNSWDGLSTEIFLKTIREYLLVETGQLSVGEFRIRLLCYLMKWNWRKFRDEDAIANLIVFSEQLTFPFRIMYPDDNAALKELSNDDYAVAVRTEPDHIDAPWAKVLQGLGWRYQFDLCFFRQMLPTLQVGEMTYYGYEASLSHHALTTSLTALQYIEARDLIGKPDSLPLMAAILYMPQPYDSSQAHALADEFSHLDDIILQAVRMNFEAVNNFLFTKTSFNLLTRFEKDGKTKSITTDMTDALYDLSHDGLGNVQEIEQLNVLTYLRILRKKTIDSVRQLHGMKMELDKIATEVGLPIEIITKIV